MRLRRLTLLSFLVALVAAALCGGFAAGPAVAHTVAKGIMDERLRTAKPAAVARDVREDATGLHTSFTRIIANWSLAQPHGPGTYNTTYLKRLETIVQECKQHGLKVIVTVCYTPRWASDRTFWKDPPATYTSGVYESFYPIAPAYLGDFAGFALKLSQLLRGEVFGYECWNEPNLWTFIYPQRTAGDPHFAATLYVAMLRHFAPAIRRGDPQARVIAGATGPMGDNDRYRTSPQSFARTLKAAGAGRLFDAYSHHPYAIGGMSDPAPWVMPPRPNVTVALANLKALLRIFPGKPFYLTEYGYNTKPSVDFGYFAVSERTQARYLRAAYAVAGRYAHVKLLMWYLVQDTQPAGQPEGRGVYMGLRRVDGSKKPAWKVFARLP